MKGSNFTCHTSEGAVRLIYIPALDTVSLRSSYVSPQLFMTPLPHLMMIFSPLTPVFFSFLFTPCFLPSPPLLFLHPPVSLFSVSVLCGLGLNLSLGVVYGRINRHCCGILGAIRNLVEALVMMCDVGRALAGGRDMHGELVFMRARQLTFSCRILRKGTGDVCVINCVKPWRLITPLCFSSRPTLLSLSCHSTV